MISNIRISTLVFAGTLALTGCGDKEPQTTATETTQTTQTTDDSASSTGDTDASATATTGTASAGTTAVTATMTASATDGTTGETEGCTFIDCMDGGGPDTNECDVWAQDCPDGEKCMPYANDGGGSWNALKCSPVNPNPGQSGDECTVEGNAVSGIDSCDLGLLCWYVDAENNGSCLDQCTGTEDSPMCPANTVCDVTNEGVLTLCLPTCDPLLIDCPMGQICFFSGLAGNFICDFDGSGEMGAYGDPCEFINVCDPGLFCADAAGVPGCQAGGCCSEYCNISEPNSCSGQDGGQECVPWFEEGEAPPGLENVGGCTIP